MVGEAAGLIGIGLWILATLTSATVVQRVYIAWQGLPQEAPQEAPEKE